MILTTLISDMKSTTISLMIDWKRQFTIQMARKSVLSHITEITKMEKLPFMTRMVSSWGLVTTRRGSRYPVLWCTLIDKRSRIIFWWNWASNQLKPLFFMTGKKNSPTRCSWTHHSLPKPGKRKY